MPVKKTFLDDEVFTKMQRAVIQGMLDVGELFATNVGKNTPVLTGRLRSSIEPSGEVQIKNGRVYSTSVQSDVEYAKFVEFGTSKMQPRAMFRKGADETVPKIPELIKRRTKNV